MDAKAELVQLREECQQLRSRLDSMEGRLHALEEKDKPPEVLPEKKQLRDCIIEILENSNEPLTAKEIADLLEEVGYTTRALKKHWPTMILQCLANSPEFRRVTRYRCRPTRYDLVGAE